MLVGIALVLVLGVGAQWLADRLRIPGILLLLTAGFLGGASGRVDPDALLGPLLEPVVAIGVGIILFEGGLTLKIDDVRGHGGVVFRLITIGALVTLVLATGLAMWLVDLPLGLALLVGGILTVTGPTVVGPLLRHVRPQGDTGPILKWEGILIDPIGALMALLIFEGLARSGPAAATGAISGFLYALVAGGAVGGLAALLLFIALRRRVLPDHLAGPVTLAFVVAAFVAADRAFSEAGLVATTAMGVLLANQSRVHVHHTLAFKENLTVLLLSALFVLLAARIQLDDLIDLGMGGLAFVAALILLVRPVSVFVSTARSALQTRERVFCRGWRRAASWPPPPACLLCVLKNAASRAQSAWFRSSSSSSSSP